MYKLLKVLFSIIILTVTVYPSLNHQVDLSGFTQSNTSEEIHGEELPLLYHSSYIAASLSEAVELQVTAYIEGPKLTIKPPLTVDQYVQIPGKQPFNIPVQFQSSYL